MIERLLETSRLLGSADVQPDGGVMTLTRQKWNDLSNEQMLGLYSRFNLHIVASRGDPPLISGLKADSWDDLERYCGLDMYSQRAVHGE